VTTSTDKRAADPRIAWYRNVRILRVVVQSVFVAAVFTLLFWLFNNLINNLDRLRIGTDFGFLGRSTGFQIPYDEGFDPRSPVRDMVLVGVKNTLLAGFFGILLATVLGVIIGVSRLSTNWLVAKLAAIYVETFRNIPPLIIIIFFGFAVFTYGPFPVLSNAAEIRFPGADRTGLILSNTVWGIPSFLAGPNIGVFWASMAVAVVAAAVAFGWRTRLHERTGAPERRARCRRRGAPDRGNRGRPRFLVRGGLPREADGERRALRHGGLHGGAPVAPVRGVDPGDPSHHRTRRHGPDQRPWALGCGTGG